MGQYYHVINVDKRQQLIPFDYGNGTKLMEWSYDQNDMVLALMNLLAEDWCGDRVYVIGDYADLSDPDEAWATTLEMLQSELHTDDLYEITSQYYARVIPQDVQERRWVEDKTPIRDKPADMSDYRYRYINNLFTGQYIDLRKCPIEWSWRYNKTGECGVTSVSPLPLLLAMGNGRGGGDYRSDKNAHLCGSWCATSSGIRITKDAPHPAAHTEFCPDFTENDPVIPYTQRDEEIAKWRRRNGN